MANVAPETTIALVTGANQGIGFEVVKKLASEHPDYHVILSGRRADAVQQATSTLKEQGLGVTPLVLDIDSDESIAAAVKAVDDSFGRLDVLVNNSAISGINIADSRDRWQAVLNTNVAGTAIVTDAFLPLLAKSAKTKRVVFVSSLLGSLGIKADTNSTFPWRKANFGAYTVSKTALNMLALHYAVDHEDDKTWKFNAADPGHHCKSTLNNFTASEDPALGAVSICKLATLGSDGHTGTFINDLGSVPW